MTEQTPIVQKLRDLSTEAHANSVNASYDTEKSRQHGRMQAFLEAARLVESGELPAIYPQVHPIGPPLRCIICERTAHWQVEGTSYCREHAVEMLDEIRRG